MSQPQPMARAARKARRKPGSLRRWSLDDDAMIRLLYPTTDSDALAARLGRSTRALLKRAGDLGVRKTPEFLASLVQRRAHDLRHRAVEEVLADLPPPGPRLEHRPGDRPGIVRITRHRLL